MPFATWPSALFGVALGALNVAASYALWRVGRGRPQQAFLVIVFGGLVARLLAVTAAVLLVLVALPVNRLAFVGGFLVAFAVGTAAEVFLIQRTVRSHP